MFSLGGIKAMNDKATKRKPRRRKTGRLWRYDPKVKGPKYLVKRRDGTVPEWPWFVIGAKDPAASAALIAYAEKAKELGYDPKFVSDVRQLAAEFANYCVKHGQGDPDARPHRKDDPATVAEMSHAQ